MSIQNHALVGVKETLFAWEDAKKMKRQRTRAARALRQVFDLSWPESHRAAKAWVAGDPLQWVLESLVKSQTLAEKPGRVLRPPHCSDHPGSSCVACYVTPRGRWMEISYDCCGAVYEMKEVPAFVAPPPIAPAAPAPRAYCPACTAWEDENPRMVGQECRTCGDRSGSAW